MDNDTIVSIASDHTLYAHWGDTYVTVTFKDMGTVVKTVSVVKGSKLAESQFPDETYSEGYKKNAAISAILYPTEFVHKIKFGWWYDEAGKYVEFNENTVVSDDMVVELAPKQLKTQIYISKNSEGITLQADYAIDTRFADTAKDLLWNNKTRLLAATSILSAEDKAKEQLRKRGVIDSADNVLIQKLFVKFVSVIGESKLEGYIVGSAKDMFTTNESLRNSMEDYINTVADSDAAKAKKLIKEAVDYQTSTAAGMVAVKNLMRTKLNSNDSFYAAACNALESAGFTIPAGASKADVIDEIVDEFETDAALRARIISEFADLVIDRDRSIISELVEYAVEYIDKDTATRDEIVDDIIDSMYRDTLDKLLDELKTKDRFEINNGNYFVAEGLKQRLNNDYRFDEMKKQIPSKVFEVYPEAKMREIYEAAYQSIIDQIDNAITEARAGNKAYIDSGFKFVADPVADIYIPLHTRLKEIAEGKFGGNYYYADNKYLQELIKLTDWSNIFTYDASVKSGNISGYKIKSVEEYYDLAVKISIIGDDALIWYTDNLSSSQLDDLISDYETLVLKYVNIVAKAAGDYVYFDTIPAKANNRFVRAFESAIKNKYPELVDKLIDKYKNSPIKDAYDHNDYTEYKNKVIKVFENVNLTTDEFFDNVLSDYYSKAKAEKISDDEYKITYKGNYITIRRVIEP